jgi:NAD(P)-dependent dehydrogenase (short-subunit alcohol dehydrogenase family)
MSLTRGIFNMRHWFITGLSSGLGRALAIAAIDAGDIVSGTVRTVEAQLGFNAIHPANANAFVADVTDHDAVAAAIAGAALQSGGIDILVNNAGYSFLGTVEEAEWPDIRAQVETNLFGPIAAIKAALPGMRAKRNGLIINVSSSAAFSTGGGVGFYASTKLALEGISKALSHELADFGIKVMVAVPGAYRTDLAFNRKTPVEAIADYAEQNAVRRAFLTKLSGQQRGDPRKAAAVILEAVSANSIPLYLPLGPDAVESITNLLQRIGDDVSAWETAARGTDLETL